MMKKLYFLVLLFIGFSSTTFAQRYADFELFSAEIGTSATNMSSIVPNQKIYLDGKTAYHLKYIVINHGPDTLAYDDTVSIKPGLGNMHGNVYRAYGFPQTTFDTLGILSYPYPFSIPAGITPPMVITAPWCDSLWISVRSGTTPLIDPDISNNYFCQPVELNCVWAVGINTIKGEKDGFLLYPNPADNMLNLRFDFVNARDVYILLRNSIGQVVHTYTVGDYSGTFTQSIDITNFPPGMYTAELHYDNQSIISKVMIQ